MHSSQVFPPFHCCYLDAQPSVEEVKEVEEVEEVEELEEVEEVEEEIVSAIDLSA